MKNSLSKSFILLFSLFTLLTTCEKEIPLVIEEKEQKTAVLCNFSPGEPFNIELTKSTSLLSNTTNEVNIADATITICSDGFCAPAVPQASSTKTKFLLSDGLILPEMGKSYNIQIDIEDQPTLSGKSYIPSPIEITHSSIGEIIKYPVSIFDSIPIQDYQVRLAFQFMDDPNKENFYQVNFYQVLDARLPTASQDSSTATFPNLYLSTIDDKLTGVSNPIDGGILFNDRTFRVGVQEFVFEPVFSFDKTLFEKPIEIVLELRSVSKEYYNFYSSAYRQTNQGDNVPFSTPTMIYSNITNGLGVFAGYSNTTLKTEIDF